MFTDEESSDFPCTDGENFPFCVEVEPRQSSVGIVSLSNKRDTPIAFKTMVCDADAISLETSTGRLEGRETICIRFVLNQTRDSAGKDHKIKFLVINTDQSGGDVGAQQCKCAFQALGQRVFEKTVVVKDDGSLGGLGYFFLELYGWFQGTAKEWYRKLSEVNFTPIVVLILMVVSGALTYRQACKNSEQGLLSRQLLCYIPILSNYISKCSPTWADIIVAKICHR